MKNTLLTIIIILLLIANGYQYWHCKDCPQDTITKVRTDTIRVIETLTLEDIVIPDPEIIEVETHHRDTFWEPGDTVILEIRDTIIHENLNIYRDTIEVAGNVDTHGQRGGRSLSGVEVIYEHLIRGDLLSSKYHLTIPTTTINSTNRTYIREYNHQVFGVAGVVSNPAFFDVQLGVQYLHQDRGFQYTYAVGQQIHTFTFIGRVFRR